MKILLWTICVALAGVVIYDSAVLLLAALRSSAVSAESEAYTRRGAGNARHVLVVGDSTAVGTGSAAPKCSVAGRLAADFPQIAVSHRGKNGALTRQVLVQISREPRDSYDLALVQTGGNDVLRFTDTGTLREQLTALLSAAKDSADQVILMSVGNLGEAPAIPWPLSYLYSWRSRLVRDLFSEVASKMGVAYVDLFTPAGEQSPFQEDPQQHYSRDGLHPSAVGYGVWYEKLRSTQPLAKWLGRGASELDNSFEGGTGENPERRPDKAPQDASHRDTDNHKEVCE